MMSYKLKTPIAGLRETISDEEYEDLHPLVQHKYEGVWPDKNTWDKLVPGNHNEPPSAEDIEAFENLVYGTEPIEWDEDGDLG